MDTGINNYRDTRRHFHEFRRVHIGQNSIPRGRVATHQASVELVESDRDGMDCIVIESRNERLVLRCAPHLPVTVQSGLPRAPRERLLHGSRSCTVPLTRWASLRWRTGTESWFASEGQPASSRSPSPIGSPMPRRGRRWRSDEPPASSATLRSGAPSGAAGSIAASRGLPMPGWRRRGQVAS